MSSGFREREEIRRRLAEMDRRTFLRYAGYGGAAIALGPLLAACSSDNATGTTAGVAGTAGAAARGGTLTMVLHRDVDTLDPHVTGNGGAWTVASLTTETLLRIDDELNVHPALADSWSLLDDGSIELSLKQGITFSDGTTFDAEAVKVNMDRMVAPETGSQVAGLDMIPARLYDGTEIVDDSTVRIHFTEPYGPLLLGLAHPTVAMMSPTAIRDLGPDIGEQPVGTGPFEFVEWVRQTHVTLKKRQDYEGGGAPFTHSGPAYLDEIRLLLGPDPSTRLGLLEGGEAQLVENVPPQDLQRLQDSGFNIVNGLSPGTPQSTFLNTESAPTNDIELRKAMLHATNREEINDTLFFGFGVPEYGPLSSNSFGYDPVVETMYPFDLEKAKQILDDAGWIPGDDGIRVKDGVRAEILHYVHDFFAVPIEPLWQAQQAEIGIEINLEQRDGAVAFQAILDGETQSMSDGYSAIDPQFVLGCYFNSSNLGVCTISHYVTEELDGILDEASGTSDLDVRKKLYSEAQKIIMGNALMIPFVNFTTAWGSAANVEGWSPWVGSPSVVQLYDAFIAE